MGIIHRMQKANPEKSFYLLTTGLVCPTMKRTTLVDVVKTMEGRENEITVPEEVRLKAKRALDLMLEVK
jgi:quinolinate synthase